MGLLGNLFGSGSKSAYDTSALAAATNQANTLNKSIYEQLMAAGQGYTDTGAQANTMLQGQLGQLTSPFTYNEFNADPSYGFMKDEAMKAVERSAAARGSVFAPSTMTALQDRAAGLASTEYNNAFNRNQAQKASIFDILMGATGLGQGQQAMNADNAWGYADRTNENNIGLQNANLAAYQAKNANRQSMLANWINAGARVASAGMA